MGQHGTKRGVMVYLPEELHRWLKARAALDGVSLSALIEEAARKAHPPTDWPPTGVRESEERYQSGRSRDERRGQRK
ncbi:MAG: hypothetical protein HYX89_08060 [Chloroflexi bacterium]|nr:hypothetical protein [Chloroflexota bacterium]